jgi:uncharacterized protein (DUF736 family)
MRMECLDFEAEVSQFLLDDEPGGAGGGAGRVRRVYDPALLKRGRDAAVEFQPHLDAALQRFQAQHPELCMGLQASASTAFRPKGTPGQFRVLLSLIDVVLGPKGAERTQDECRQAVETLHPQFPVTKTWTKPLPPWAVRHAKKIVLCSSHPISTLVVKQGASLKDLHTAVKIAMSKDADDAPTFRVSLSILPDAVIINGVRFKRTVNKSNGRDYSVVRLAIPALQAAAQRKAKAS